MMTEKYCPRGEIKKLETEIWNLKGKGTDVVSYTQRFQELALLCGRMFHEVSDEVEKYFGRLPDMIQGTENKRKLDDNSRNNQKQQQPFKKQNVARPYTAGLVRRKCTEDLNLCALNATTIIMGSVHQGATNAKKLAIWPVIIGVLLLMLTLRGLSLALSVTPRKF
ncbi:hypothetical protein Tco_1217171 [Tanacetum coccineum]